MLDAETDEIARREIREKRRTEGVQAGHHDRCLPPAKAGRLAVVMAYLTCFAAIVFQLMLEVPLHFP